MNGIRSRTYPATLGVDQAQHLASTTRKRVLVLDDAPELANALRASLRQHAVSTASNAEHALEQCAEQRFDLILCDLQTPTCGATDFYSALKRQGRGQEENVVFMTGSALSPSARELTRQLPNHVLHKPHAAGALQSVARVTSTLEQGTAALPEAALPREQSAVSRVRRATPFD